MENRPLSHGTELRIFSQLPQSCCLMVSKYERGWRRGEQRGRGVRTCGGRHSDQKSTLNVIKGQVRGVKKYIKKKSVFLFILRRLFVFQNGLMDKMPFVRSQRAPMQLLGAFWCRLIIFCSAKTLDRIKGCKQGTKSERAEQVDHYDRHVAALTSLCVNFAVLPFKLLLLAAIMRDSNLRVAAHSSHAVSRWLI